MSQQHIMRGGERLIFYAFDLLSLDGKDLRSRPCQDRRALLGEPLAAAEPSSPIQLGESFEGSGAEFFAAAEGMGLEGIISKSRASTYQSGRSTDWLKIKTFDVSAFTIIGYERSSGFPATLLVASEDGDRLNYVGRVMVTLGGKAREALWSQLEERHLAQPTQREWKRKGVQWVRPGMKVKVRHLRGEEALRHATMVA